MSQELYQWLEEMGPLPEPINEIPGGDLYEWLLAPEEEEATPPLVWAQGSTSNASSNIILEAIPMAELSELQCTGAASLVSQLSANPVERLHVSGRQIFIKYSY